MPYTKAGRYNELIFFGGRLAPNTDVTINLTGTSTGATLYTDKNKTSSIPGSIVRSDTSGNLAFYTEPGHYDLVLGNNRIVDIVVEVDKDEPLGSSLSILHLETTDTTQDAVRFKSDSGDGRGQRTRFSIENNPASANVDLNYRDVAIEIGSYDASISTGCNIRMLQPAAPGTNNLFQIFPPGRNPAVNGNPAFYITPYGAVGIQVGGLASVALFIKSGGDANSKFEISETGILSWGSGGGSVVDTNLYRSAADNLKTDDTLNVGPYISFTAPNGLIHTDGRVEFGGIPKWNDAGLSQTTVGAAGGASALPATPTKYLKVDHGGITYVVPAYTAV